MRRLLQVLGITALAAAGGCACTGSERCYSTSRSDTDRVARVQVPCDDPAVCPDLIGPRGPDGPSGPVGERGQTGQTGAPGYAVAGPRGEQGETGFMGEQGRTGAAGSSGVIVRGRAGAVGPSGPQGATGATGQTGVRGESAPGYAGPAGPRGATGVAGATGPSGIRGVALEGPTGPAGRAGPAGAQGVTGYIGAQGSTTPGIAGSMGPAGVRGPQGPTGEIGPQGVVGVLDCWTSYRDFWFQQNVAEFDSFESDKLMEVAAYAKRNPSLDIGIDGSADPRGIDARTPNLNERRVKTIHDGLIAAGVPSSQIKVGAFGDPALRRDGRIEVLIITSN